VEAVVEVDFEMARVVYLVREEGVPAPHSKLQRLILPVSLSVESPVPVTTTLVVEVEVGITLIVSMTCQCGDSTGHDGVRSLRRTIVYNRDDTWYLNERRAAKSLLTPDMS
jgi:hypothetical protein